MYIYICIHIALSLSLYLPASSTGDSSGNPYLSPVW